MGWNVNTRNERANKEEVWRYIRSDNDKLYEEAPYNTIYTIEVSLDRAMDSIVQGSNISCL